ncbi:MAG TPA: hypothetical protein PK419_00835 [Spirochaetota bacterium]|nr:hypothetical protein [Spirochaetota bacterium]
MNLGIFISVISHKASVYENEFYRKQYENCGFCFLWNNDKYNGRFVFIQKEGYEQMKETIRDYKEDKIYKPTLSSVNPYFGTVVLSFVVITFIVIVIGGYIYVKDENFKKYIMVSGLSFPGAVMFTKWIIGTFKDAEYLVIRGNELIGFNRFKFKINQFKVDEIVKINIGTYFCYRMYDKEGRRLMTLNAGCENSQETMNWILTSSPNLKEVKLDKIKSYHPNLVYYRRK